MLHVVDQEHFGWVKSYLAGKQISNYQVFPYLDQVADVLAAADLVVNKIHETLTYYQYPVIQWIRIRANNPLERIMKVVRGRTRLDGAFPAGHSILMLVVVRLRHFAYTKWGCKRYLGMELLRQKSFKTN